MVLKTTPMEQTLLVDSNPLLLESIIACGFVSIGALFGSFKLPGHDRFSHCCLSMEGEPITVVACGNGNTVPLLTPGAGKIWGEFVTINPDPTTSRRQPWKCTLCHHKYGKTSANASRVAQHVCGRAGNVAGCPGATMDEKRRFPTHLCLPPVPSIPSSSTTASATSLVRPSPSSQKRPRERTEEDVMREAFGEKERQAFVTNRLQEVVPNIKSMLMTAGDKATLDSLWTEAFAHAGIPPNAIDDDYVRHAIYETSKIQVHASSSHSSSPSPSPSYLNTPLLSECFPMSGVIWSVPLGVNATRSARRWRSHRWLNTDWSASFCCSARSARFIILLSECFPMSGVIWSVPLGVNATRSARRWLSHDGSLLTGLPHSLVLLVLLV
jgi:hypothetical protein